MDNQKVKFLLDLDIKDFTDQIFRAKGEVQQLGSKENLVDLIEGLSQVGIALGAVGLAAFTVKEALDLTIEGEKIKKISQQFEQLSATAGISSSQLKAGLEQSAKGLIDNTDLLQEANRAMVTMGSSTAKLPELLDLARKATSVYGGNFKDNFENITRAIEMGNTRMLKHMGIIVDAQKATDAYAKSQGLASDELSEFGKRQAILEAVLKQGGKAFAGVKENLGDATYTLQMFKVAVHEIGEIITLVFEKTMGPTVRKAMGGLKDAVVDLKRYFTATFGEGMEQNVAQLERLNLKIADTEKQIESLEKKKGTAFDFAPGDTISRLQVLKTSLIEYHAQLDQLQKKKEEISTADEKAEKQRQQEVKDNGQEVQQDLINKEKMEQNEIKFRDQMLKVRKQYLDLESNQVNSVEEVERALKDRQVQAEMEHQLRLDEIKQEYKNKNSQREQAMAAERRRFEAQQRQDATQTEKEREKLLAAYQKKATNVFDGVGRSFKKHSMQAKAEQGDFGKKGEEVYLSFQKHGVEAFEQVGAAIAAHKSVAAATADAMKTMFMNMLADRAEAEGALLLATSIYPPNPLGLAAGAGLLALSGFLRAMAGGGGSSNVSGVSSVSGGGGTTQAQDQANAQPLSNTSGAAASTDVSSTVQDGTEMASMARPQKSVTISIAGNYFDTDSSRRQLMDIIRSETDATDFRYNRIGQV